MIASAGVTLAVLLLLHQGGVRDDAEQVQAVSVATREVARVLLRFAHRCTPSQRAALERVLSDPSTSSAQRPVVQALLRAEHVVMTSDRPRLDAVINNHHLPLALRTVARLLLRLVHVPTVTDRDLLERIVAAPMIAAHSPHTRCVSP